MSSDNSGSRMPKPGRGTSENSVFVEIEGEEDTTRRPTPPEIRRNWPRPQPPQPPSNPEQK